VYPFRSKVLTFCPLFHFLFPVTAHMFLLSPRYIFIGIIEQIPQVIYAATTGHGRTITTDIATYSFHQLMPEIFCGFDWYGNRQDFLVAAPEKALVDSLYLSSRKGQRFGVFPELSFSSSFSFPSARKWAKRITDDRIRGYVLKKLRNIEARD